MIEALINGTASLSSFEGMESLMDRYADGLEEATQKEQSERKSINKCQQY